MSLSPFPMKDVLTDQYGTVSVTWREWFLNLFTEVKNLLARATTLETEMDAVEARATAVEADVSAADTRFLVEHTAGGAHEWPTTSRTFSAADFTGSGSMTWGVDSADVTFHEYGLSGGWMLISFHITGTDVAGVADSELRIALPAGFLTAGWGAGSLYYSDAGGALTTGSVLHAPGEAHISLYKSPVANWTLTAGDNTRVIGSVLLRVVAA